MQVRSRPAARSSAKGMLVFGLVKVFALVQSMLEYRVTKPRPSKLLDSRTSFSLDDLLPHVSHLAQSSAFACIRSLMLFWRRHHTLRGQVSALAVGSRRNDLPVRVSLLGRLRILLTNIAEARGSIVATQVLRAFAP